MARLYYVFLVFLPKVFNLGAFDARAVRLLNLEVGKLDETVSKVPGRSSELG